MQPRTQLRRIATFNYAAQQTIEQQLSISGRIRGLFLELSGTLDVTGGGGTAIARNPGTLVPVITLLKNRVEVLKQGRWLDWVDRAGIFWKLPNEDATAAAVAADTFRSRIYLPFCVPWGVNPTDSVLEISDTDRLDLQITWGSPDSLLSGGTKSLTAGGAVAPTVDVIAEISQWDSAPNWIYHEDAFDSPALSAVANTDLNLQLVAQPGRAYHHFALVAEDNPGAAGRTLVATAINNARIDATAPEGVFNPWGPLSGDEIQQEFDQRMRPISAVRTGVYPIAFQPRFDGGIFYNLDADLSDLRFRIDHAAFATAGTIRVLQGWLTRIRR